MFNNLFNFHSISTLNTGNTMVSGLLKSRVMGIFVRKKTISLVLKLT